jgi:hypothetical protein
VVIDETNKYSLSVRQRVELSPCSHCQNRFAVSMPGKPLQKGNAQTLPDLERRASPAAGMPTERHVVFQGLKIGPPTPLRPALWAFGKRRSL